MKAHIKIISALIFISGFNMCFANVHARGNNISSKPYNVILIMTDDQGYGDLACHGNPYIETPALDKLHDESIRFRNFHVNPFCAPTRAALMTGRHADLTHVRATIHGRNHMNVEETTMAEFFKTSGYTTGHFGKWHLGHNYPYRSIDRGFDQWVGHGDGGTGTASDYWGNDKMNDTYYRNGKWEKFEGFSTDIYFNEAMKFINTNKNKPFFVYLATNVPHGPCNVMLDWRKKYEEKSKTAGRWIPSDFYATISRFDENLGRLREYLSSTGLDKNTVVIYLTDNGSAGGSGVFNAGMQGHKGSVYEGGHRVPCFFHLPSKKGTITKNIDRFTAHIDLLPTLIDLCHLKTPEKAKFNLSGRSLLGLIEGTETGWKDRTHFLHSQNGSQQYTKWRKSMVATEKWRLINQSELYDIKADPGQENNVDNEFPEVVKELQKDYDQFWKEIKEGTSPYARPIIGTGKINYTWLACDGWIPSKRDGGTCYQRDVNGGTRSQGFWPVRIAKRGKYNIEVRRWPKETSCPITGAPKQKDADIYKGGRPVVMSPGYKFSNIVKVRLKVGDENYNKEIKPSDTFAEFNLELDEGDTSLQAWLIDGNGEESPSYYIYNYE